MKISDSYIYQEHSSMKGNSSKNFNILKSNYYNPKEENVCLIKI